MDGPGFYFDFRYNDLFVKKRERERGEDRGRDGFRNLGDVFKTLEGNFLTTL